MTQHGVLPVDDDTSRYSGQGGAYVVLVSVTSGSGMTVAFGLAVEVLDDLLAGA